MRKCAIFAAAFFSISAAFMCSSCFARGGEDPFARKWFLANEIDFKASDKECTRLETLLGTAREAGYNGVMISSWLGLDVLHTPIWTPERKERLMRIKRRCDELGLEIGVCVWTFGYARQGFFKIDQNLSAAAPVFDTRYRVEDGRCVHLSRPTRKLVESNSATIHAPRISSDVPDFNISVTPRRSYRIRIKASASGVAGGWPFTVAVRRPGAKSDYIEHRIFKPKADGTERTYEVLFSSLAETNVTIECRSYNRNYPGRAVLSSVELFETEPLLVVRRSGTPVRVRRVRDWKVLKEGVDFAEIPKAKTLWPGSNTKLVLKPIKGGAMKDGDEISVDCFCSFPAWGRWTSACMASPELFKEMEASAAEIARTLNPKVWELSFDEVRQGGGCLDCRKVGDMAHIYARCVKKAMSIIRKHRPDAEIFIYNDMVDPYYMKDEGRYAGLYSPMKGVWDLLPRDLGIDCWTHSTREKAPKFFSDRGHPILISAFYDEKELKNSAQWRDVALKTPGVKGVIYSTYAGNWSFLKPFAELMKKPADLQ